MAPSAEVAAAPAAGPSPSEFLHVTVVRDLLRAAAQSLVLPPVAPQEPAALSAAVQTPVVPPVVPLFPIVSPEVLSADVTRLAHVA